MSFEDSEEQSELTHIAGGSLNWNIYFGKMQYLLKLNIYLPYDPEVPLLGVNETKLKALILVRHTQRCL